MTDQKKHNPRTHKTAQSKKIQSPKPQSPKHGARYIAAHGEREVLVDGTPLDLALSGQALFVQLERRDRAEAAVEQTPRRIRRPARGKDTREAASGRRQRARRRRPSARWRPGRQNFAAAGGRRRKTPPRSRGK